VKKSLVTMVIIVTGILSILITILTYYGSYSGNFIVIIDSKENVTSIVLSETSDFTDASPRLFADSVNDTIPLAYYDLKINEAVQAEGNYFDPDFRYFAYSFYLKNVGNQVLTVETQYLITESFRDADKVIRVVIIKNEDVGNLKMYMQKDSIDFAYPINYPTPIYFLDVEKGIVFTEKIINFYPGDVIKFTVINYVECNDPDCSDAIAGGLIKMTMKFSIIDSRDIEEELRT